MKFKYCLFVCNPPIPCEHIINTGSSSANLRSALHSSPPPCLHRKNASIWEGGRDAFSMAVDYAVQRYQQAVALHTSSMVGSYPNGPLQRRPIVRLILNLYIDIWMCVCISSMSITTQAPAPAPRVVRVRSTVPPNDVVHTVPQAKARGRPKGKGTAKGKAKKVTAPSTPQPKPTPTKSPDTKADMDSVAVQFFRLRKLWSVNSISMFWRAPLNDLGYLNICPIKRFGLFGPKTQDRSPRVPWDPFAVEPLC